MSDTTDMHGPDLMRWGSECAKGDPEPERLTGRKRLGDASRTRTARLDAAGPRRDVTPRRWRRVGMAPA